MGWWSSLKRKVTRAVKTVVRKVTRTVKRVVRAARSAIRQVINTAKEAVNRLIGIADFFASLAGILPWKKLRLKVIILRKEDSSPVQSARVVEPSIKRMIGIFAEQARVRVIPSGDVFIKTLDDAAPAAALSVRCDSGAWKEDFGEAGDYFSRNMARNASGLFTGYTAPVTAFIVWDIVDKCGCSLGPLTDYVTVRQDCVTVTGGIGTLTLAHEVGHACGLPHWWGKGTLMEPGGASELLKRWQRAILRNSRHVTYL